MILRLANLIHNFGWIVLVSFFYPVYWTQDSQMKNNGYDIITIRDTDKAYFYETWAQNKF